MGEEKVLYVKTLLMAGKPCDAVSMVKNEKNVGRSYSSAGVVFGAVLSILTGHSEKAGTIQCLLKDNANKTSMYSGSCSIDDGTDASFYEEVMKGLKNRKDAKFRAAESLSWALKIGNRFRLELMSGFNRNDCPV